MLIKFSLLFSQLNLSGGQTIRRNLTTATLTAQQLQQLSQRQVLPANIQNALRAAAGAGPRTQVITTRPANAAQFRGQTASQPTIALQRPQQQHQQPIAVHVSNTQQPRIALQTGGNTTGGSAPGTPQRPTAQSGSSHSGSAPSTPQPQQQQQQQQRQPQHIVVTAAGGQNALTGMRQIVMTTQASGGGVAGTASGSGTQALRQGQILQVTNAGVGQQQIVVSQSGTLVLNPPNKASN